MHPIVVMAERLIISIIDIPGIKSAVASAYQYPTFRYLACCDIIENPIVVMAERFANF